MLLKMKRPGLRGMGAPWDNYAGDWWADQDTAAAAAYQAAQAYQQLAPQLSQDDAAVVNRAISAGDLWAEATAAEDGRVGAGFNRGSGQQLAANIYAAFVIRWAPVALRYAQQAPVNTGNFVEAGANARRWGDFMQRLSGHATWIPAYESAGAPVGGAAAAQSYAQAAKLWYAFADGQAAQLESWQRNMAAAQQAQVLRIQADQAAAAAKEEADQAAAAAAADQAAGVERTAAELAAQAQVAAQQQAAAEQAAAAARASGANAAADGFETAAAAYAAQQEQTRAQQAAQQAAADAALAAAEQGIRDAAATQTGTDFDFSPSRLLPFGRAPAPGLSAGAKVGIAAAAAGALMWWFTRRRR